MIAWLFFKELNVKYPVKLVDEVKPQQVSVSSAGIADTVVVPKVKV